MEYKFTINALDILKQDNDLQYVVYNIHWVLTAYNEQGTTASAIGTKKIPAPDLENFTPYENLTDEIVIGWLQSEEVDSNDLKKNLEKQIYEKENPTKETRYNPFSEKEE